MRTVGRWVGFPLAVSLVAGMTGCASASKSARKIASRESPAFDEALARTGLRSFRANLHSHHFMKAESRRGPGADEDGGEGEESGGNQKFPFDDGRPSRREAGGRNLFTAPALSERSPDHFAMACDYGGKEGELDILFVTPHTKNGEMSGEADTGLDAFVDRHAMLDGIGRQAGDSFYCGLGQEASSISAGNHVNVLGHFSRSSAGKTEPYFFPAGAFERFYPQIRKRAEAGEPVVLQLNHPGVSRDLWWGDLQRASRKNLKQALNDYGLDDYAPVGCAIKKKLGKPMPEGCGGGEPNEISWETLRATYAAIRKDAGDRFRLIEVVSPAGATSNPGVEFKRVHSRVSEAGVPAPSASEVPRGLSDYVYYLNMGFRLGPTANQDNHHMNWGSAVASRTGVLARSLSEADVLEALDARRTFASEDRNARALVAVSDGAGGEVTVMGGEAKASGESVALEISYSDPDAEDSRALVRVYRYKDGEKLDFHFKASPLAPLRWVSFEGDRTVLPARAPGSYLPSDGASDVLVLAAGETRRIQLPVEEGLQYVFVELTQASDQDKLWTAPVWIRK